MNLRTAVVCGGVTLAAALPAAAQANGVNREFYVGLSAGTIAALTNHASFPNAPTNETLVTGGFESLASGQTYCGERLRAWLTVPASGSYQFQIAGDDESALYLSTTESPANKALIASVPDWTDPRYFDKYASQTSSDIALQAGRRYYIEVLHAQGEGGEHVTVRCRKPDATYETPIPESWLTPLYGVYREFYLTGASDHLLSSFTNSPVYPDSPVSEGLAARIDMNDTGVTYYGDRWRALLTAPTSGLYRFQIASDDESALFLSSNEAPSNKVHIARVPGWTGYQQFSNYTEQTSADVLLVAGKRYFMEVLRSQGYGGDNLSVRWRLPNGAFETPVPGFRLTPPPPLIGQPLADQSRYEMETAVFDADIENHLGVFYRWQTNGVSVADGTNATYERGPLTLADSNLLVRCIASNAWGAVTTRTARLLVTRDTVAPTVDTVAAVVDPEWISVVFSEPVDWATATNRFNYTVNGVVPLEAVRGLDERTVVLRTAPRAPGSSGQLVVSNVRDRAPAPNTIAPHTTVAFVNAPLETAPMDRVLGAAEPRGPSSRRTGLVISEIHYDPAPRADGRRTEFVEIHNPQPFHEDLGGWRLSGELDCVFPSNTVLGAGGYLVVAPAPADIVAVYGATNVFAGSTNGLDNGGGAVRLRDEMDHVRLEMEYDDDLPWPAAAAGAGHSLVLARPSRGEASVRAWAASDRIGGTPSAADVPSSHAWRTVRLNEILAHTDPPDVDYIELFNYGTSAVSIAGCVLTDDPATNRFVIPAGTTLPARGFRHFTQDELGFALNAAGETILLKDPSGTRVIDALAYGAQENGVAFGHAPDGAPEWSRLLAQTPGTNNAAARRGDVVISEIMYHPVSEDDAEEFVELQNRTGAAIGLDRWRLEAGVSYTFPSNAVIPAGGRVVVAEDRDRLLALYPALAEGAVYGNYQGALADRGERLELSKPDEIVSTNAQGRAVTNRVHVVVDEVDWGDGGRWGAWSDGGGSSLELVQTDADGRLAPSWADSDESGRSAWTNLEYTGVLELGRSDARQLQFFLQGAGECLVDDVEVRLPGGENLVANGSFESGAVNWTFQGTHDASSVCPTGGTANSACLWVRAGGRGDTGANRIRAGLSTTPSGGQTVTIRAKVRWLRGNPEIHFRLRGNWVEAPAWIVTTRALGTPGAANSRAVAQAGPAIGDVTHEPALPAAGQAVTVTARVADRQGLSQLRLLYRLDPATNYTAVVLTNRGAGFFSVRLPGQASGALLAYYLEAAGAGPGLPSARFPAGAPARECLVRFGETAAAGSFGTYRIWMTQANVNRWASRERNSNKALDATFVYGDHRAVYNAGALYSGSPWHTGGYNGPAGNLCDYVVYAPGDDRVLGVTDFTLATVGNLNNDGSYQREQAAYWLLRRLGAPGLHRRHIKVFFNGTRRAVYYEDSQQPGSDVIAQCFPGEEDGNLYKIEDWFEFDDSGDSFPDGNVNARLERYAGADGLLKAARYRWCWRKRAVRNGTVNDFSDLFRLVEAINLPDPAARAERMTDVADLEQWIRTLVLERIVGNWDSYGYGRGKNMYVYKTPGRPWAMFAWDIDMVMGSGGDAVDYQVDPGTGTCEDPVLRAFLEQPCFARAWWRAMQDACGYMADPALGTLMTAKYNAMAADGGTPGDTPSVVLSWIATRRLFILNRLAAFAAPFAVTSPSTVVTNGSAVTLSGSAPVGVRSIRVNGVEPAITWTGVTNWTLSWVLGPSTNVLNLTGHDTSGAPIGGATGRVTAVYTGAPADPRDALCIGEIEYDPLAPGAAYVEIHNRAAATPFDLSGWRLEGVDFTFPDGTVIAPGGRLLAVEDVEALELTGFSNHAAVAGVYAGRLDRGGETLRLVKPGATPAEDLVVDEVTYEDDPPWPGLARGFGSSLQVINPALDNNRVGNWAAVGDQFAEGITAVSMTNVWRYYQTGYPGAGWQQTGFNDAAWPTGQALLAHEPDALPYPKLTPLTLGQSTYYFRTSFVFAGDPAAWTWSLRTCIDDGGIFYVNGEELPTRLRLPSGAVDHSTSANDYTPGDAHVEGPFAVGAPPVVAGTNLVAAEIHQYGTSSSDIAFGLELVGTGGGSAARTPAGGNRTGLSLSSLPPVWLNEIQTQNATGAVDRFGEREPWCELHNSGASAVSLAGWYLSDSYTNLTRWAFPSNAIVNPGQFIVVWLDGEPGESTSSEWHTSFRAASSGGTFALSAPIDGRLVLIDYLSSGLTPADRAWGAWPDATPAHRRRFYYATPGGPNRIDEPVPQLVINEWMAGNTLTTADPADGDYEDWFEIYNAGANTVDLSGYTLSDDPGEPDLFTIPDGVTLGAGGFLLVWADDETGQNSTNAPHLHVAFRLSGGGDTIALYQPDGTMVASCAFGAQTDDVSEGCWPDGAPSPWRAFSVATPGAPNRNPDPNRPPVIGALTNAVVDEGTTLAYPVPASDPDASDILSFSLVGDPPPGVAIHAGSGVLTWSPTEVQGPGSYTVTVRATDNGSPPLDGEGTFAVTVREVNRPPQIAPIGPQSGDEGSPFTVTASATDPDLPASEVRFRLSGETPGGMAVDPLTGVLTWSPSETEGPGAHSITLTAYDPDDAAMLDSTTFQLTVREVNQAPQLDPVGEQSVWVGATLRLTLHAGDADWPSNTLAYSLGPGAPAGAAVDPATGVFTWTPGAGAAGTTNPVAVRAEDDGTPPLGAEQSFLVIVPAQAFEITAMQSQEGGSLRVVWNSLPGRRYRLERANAVGGTEWAPVQECDAAGPTCELALAPGDAPAGFYRVVELP